MLHNLYEGPERSKKGVLGECPWTCERLLGRSYLLVSYFQADKTIPLSFNGVQPYIFK